MARNWMMRMKPKNTMNNIPIGSSSRYSLLMVIWNTRTSYDTKSALLSFSLKTLDMPTLHCVIIMDIASQYSPGFTANFNMIIYDAYVIGITTSRRIS
jgi:hypothetical protein